MVRTRDATSERRTQPEPDDAEIGARSKALPEIRAAVDEHADEMDGSSVANRLLAARYRRRLFPRAAGRVLDVACGTGTNVEYLPDSVAYVGVDISPEMLSRAEDRFAELERGESLFEMDAQSLDFDDDSFETVISSMSTCMFPDPVAALAEMARVCDPDGRILLLEHGRSSVGPLAWLQDRRADARYRETGCRWNQEPLALVSGSEVAVEWTSTGLFGTITMVEARPESDPDR